MHWITAAWDVMIRQSTSSRKAPSELMLGVVGKEQENLAKWGVGLQRAIYGEEPPGEGEEDDRSAGTTKR